MRCAAPACEVLLARAGGARVDAARTTCTSMGLLACDGVAAAQDAAQCLADALEEEREMPLYALPADMLEDLTLDEAISLLDCASLRGSTSLSPELWVAARRRKALATHGAGLLPNGIGGLWAGSGMQYAAPCAPDAVPEARRMFMMMKPHGNPLVSPLVGLRELCMRITPSGKDPAECWNKMMLCAIAPPRAPAIPLVSWDYEPAKDAMQYEVYMISVQLNTEGLLILGPPGGGEVFDWASWSAGGNNVEYRMEPLLEDRNSCLFLSFSPKDVINSQLRGQPPAADAFQAFSASDGVPWELEVTKDDIHGCPQLRTTGVSGAEKQEFVQFGTPYLRARFRRYDSVSRRYVWWWDPRWCWIILQIWLLLNGFYILPVHPGHCAGKVTAHGINAARTLRGQTAEVRAASGRRRLCLTTGG